MAGKFVVKDKHISFANLVASGMPAWEAYVKTIAVKPDVKKETAHVRASELMQRTEIIELVEKARDERQKAMLAEQSKQAAEQFGSFVLTTDQIDAFHTQIVRGLIDVEEMYPVRTTTTTTQYGDDGVTVVATQTKTTTTFMAVKRKANIREKQRSAQELYKRRGAYPRTPFGGGDGDNEGESNTVRFILLASGERIPLP